MRPLAVWPRLVARGVGLGMVVALMLLAGHTQSVYINLFGLGLWTVWPALAWTATELRRRLPGPLASQHPPLPTSQFTIHNSLFPILLPRLTIFLSGLLLGILLSAAQLLPTLELSDLGLRSGGLEYRDATSFSLKPLQLAWTLLPSYGLRDLEQVFDTPGYTEYVAYVGLAGLLLALLGAWHGRGQARSFGLLFALLGLFLALGRWNPLYFGLHQVVPGFDLFRVPARWMMLYTLGMAVLAGVGMEWVMRRNPALHRVVREPDPSLPLPSLGRELVGGVLVLGLVALDLWLAARSLPHTQPTAPQAVYDVRTAPAHLLTDPGRDLVGPAGAGRFLGLSTITYDPGDMADSRRIYLESDPPQLSEAAFDDLVIAQKVQELLVPNLPLFWQVPTVDGFDGGVLPLQRYNQFFSLLVPDGALVPDGRLREQLQAVPPANLLNAAHVQYLVTDKVRDLWFEDVYYDRQIGARLDGRQPVVQVEVPQAFPATHVDLIASVEGDVDALAGVVLPVAEVAVRSSAGTTETLIVTAGGAPGAHLADDTLASPLAASAGATVAYRDVEGGRQEYRVRLPLASPVTPTAIDIRALDTQFPVTIQAVTLYDARTGMFGALLPSDRGRFRRVHSGDVKIYENLEASARAYLAHTVIPASDQVEALATLQEGIDWGTTAVVEGAGPVAGARQAGDRVEVISYTPERVEVQVHTAAPAALVLADAYYPGWQATVDGVPVPVHPANVLFRAVEVPEGEHTVVFAYAPTGWRTGLWLTGAGLLLATGALLVVAWDGFRRRPTRGV